MKILLLIIFLFQMPLITLANNITTPQVQNAANKKFLFKIRTSSGGTLGNILIEATDIFAAVSKLNVKYPNCEILRVEEKS